jgi:hypothetical protein
VNLLTFPLPIFRQVLRDLARSTRPIRCPVGVSRGAGRDELLAAAPAARASRYLLVTSSDSPASPRVLPPECSGVLTLGAGRRRGLASGMANLPSGPQPIGALKLVGPGMHVLPLGPSAPSADPLIHDGDCPSRSGDIAALGDESWRRLTRLHYGVVGVGSSGGILAEALASGWGVERLSLIDPHLSRPHVPGDGAIRVAAHDEAKAEALADRLRRSGARVPAVNAVSSSITRLPALHAAAACDVLFACLDHDGARLALAALAVLFCKPWLDVATRIHGEPEQRRMAADVRLIVPGERCLLCLGSVANQDARKVLASADAEQAFRAGRDGRQERMASLLSLDQLAVALGLRLWEDFVAERATAGAWVRVEFDRAGRLSVTHPQPASAECCPLCPLLGLGEEGLSRVQPLFQGDAPF